MQKPMEQLLLLYQKDIDLLQNHGQLLSIVMDILNMLDYHFYQMEK